mmetsp:Transcript_30317/g.88124  ORF Transcript_30317/g.88124 Transcript_30317/m.88124 type:complete len:259 (-) Transcript_30317:465-1241(-)
MLWVWIDGKAAWLVNCVGHSTRQELQQSRHVVVSVLGSDGLGKRLVGYPNVLQEGWWGHQGQGYRIRILGLPEVSATPIRIAQPLPCEGHVRCRTDGIEGARLCQIALSAHTRQHGQALVGNEFCPQWADGGQELEQLTNAPSVGLLPHKDLLYRSLCRVKCCGERHAVPLVVDVTGEAKDVVDSEYVCVVDQSAVGEPESGLHLQPPLAEPVALTHQTPLLPRHPLIHTHTHTRPASPTLTTHWAGAATCMPVACGC